MTEIGGDKINSCLLYFLYYLDSSLIRIASLYHNLHETLQQLLKSRNVLFIANISGMSEDELRRSIHTKPELSGEAHVAGALSLVALVAGKRKPPHVRGKT